MEAKTEFLFRLIEQQDVFFRVPLYQRKYSWGWKNWDRFFADVKDLALSITSAKTHFIGSIVYLNINDKTRTLTSEKDVGIIDGQQRLSTSFIFIKAMLDVINDNIEKLGYDEKSAQLKTRLSGTLFNMNITDNITKKPKLKLIMLKEDQYVLEKIMEPEMIKQDEKSKIELTLMFKAYKLFKTRIQNILQESSFDIKSIEDLYIGFKSLTVAHIAVDTGDEDAQNIFESLNSTGSKLSQYDLIKNYVLMNLDQSSQEILAEKLNFIENNLGKNVDNFTRYYLEAKTFAQIGEDKVFEKFKDFYKTINTTMDKPGLFVEEFLKFSNIYIDLIIPNKNGKYCKELEALQRVNEGAANPFLMLMLNDFNAGILSERELKASFEIIESYIVRRSICREITSSLPRTFIELYKKIQESPAIKNVTNFDEKLMAHLTSIKKQSEVFPDDDALALAFNAHNAYEKIKKIKEILIRIEEYNKIEKIEDWKEYTIEHIMPQNLDQAWIYDLSDVKTDMALNLSCVSGSAEVDQKTVREVTDKEKNTALAIKEKYQHSFGNLMLLHKSLNSSVKNVAFVLKKNIFKDQAITWSAKDVCSYAFWNEDTIVERNLRMFQIAKDIWPFKKINVEIVNAAENNTDQLLSLKELLEMVESDKAFFKENKPTSFYYNGNKTLVPHWKNIYIEVMKILYEYDPITTGELGNKNNKEDCATPLIELEKDVYIKSLDKIDLILKTLINICETVFNTKDSIVIQFKKNPINKTKKQRVQPALFED